MAVWEDARQKGITFIVEHRIRSASGEYRWFLVRGEPYRDPATGKLVRWYGTSTDIHDRKVSQQALQASEERYRTLTTATSQIVWCAEPSGEIFADSPSWREFTGQTYEEWKGFGWTNALHPEDPPRILPIWKQCVAERRIFEVEYRLRRADGQYRWTAVRGVPVLNTDGTIREWVGTNTDITEKKQAAIELQLSQERLRLATEGGKVGIWDWDILTDKATWSKETYQIHGLSIDEFGGTGEDFRKRVHPDDLPALWQTLESVLKNQNIFIADFRAVRPDGDVRWVANWANIYRDENGAPTRVVGTIVDITERKQAELALQEQSRRKDDFLAMLAHELRNPLAPINIAAQLLKLAGSEPTRVQKASDIITRQVKHMTELVDDLLDVSRVTRGLVVIDKEAVDIKLVIANAIEQARPLIEARHHSLHLHMDAEHTLVQGDRTRLVQVLVNILTNAAKYTPQGGRIELVMAVRGSDVEIRVSDNGSGIETELLPHIFDLFTQGERTPDRSQGGLGLGLALVKSMVGLHGGHVAAHSDGPGQGSTFTLHLPLLEENKTIASELTALSAHNLSRSSKVF
jgi:PAS domain S-box-containing protein